MTEMTTAPTLVGGAPKLPPSSRLPKSVGALAFIASRRRTVMWLTNTVGRSVTVTIPVFGSAILVSDPALAKQIFTTSPDVLHNHSPQDTYTSIIQILAHRLTHPSQW